MCSGLLKRKWEMRMTISGVPERLPIISTFWANRWVSHSVFAVGCAIAGYLCVTIYTIGGLALVSCVIACLLFAVIALADLRSAFLFAFAFSLFQPLLTRFLFYIDFPRAVSQSMLDYKDPLTTTTSLLLICCACLALLPELTGKPSSVPRTLMRLAGFFIVVNLLQVFNPNKTLVVGIYGFKNSVLPVLMILVGCLAMRSRDDLARFAKFIAWFSFFALLYGLYQEIAGLPEFESYWYSRTLPRISSMFFELGATRELRVPSVFQGYTTYSYVIVAFGILIYGLGADYAKGAWKYLRAACLVLLGLYFAFSMERIAIGMFIVGVVVFHFVTSRNRKRMLRFMLVAGVAFLLLYGLVYKTSDRLREKGWATGSTRLMRLAEMANPLTASTVASGRVRGGWKTSIDVIKKQPLLGTGVGSVTLSRALKRDEWFPALNEFFHKQIELGLFGSVAFIGILYAVYRGLLERSAARDEEHNMQRYAAAMVGVLAAYVACGVFNVPFLYESGIVFWFLTGSAFHRRGEAGAET
jgi:hypothetical protein